MPEAYEGALKDAKTGEVVGPFEVEGGWAVVRIEDRRLEEPITLEAARPQIIRFLTYDQVRDLLEKLRGRAKVETLIGAGEDVPGAPVEPADAAPEAAKTPAPDAKAPTPQASAPKTPAPKSPEAK